MGRRDVAGNALDCTRTLAAGAESAQELDHMRALVARAEGAQELEAGFAASVMDLGG